MPRYELDPPHDFPPGLQGIVAIVRANPRRALGVVLWLLMAFGIGFGVTLVVWVLSEIARWA
ncbi:MAG: hypothetical protein IRY97_12185 [Thermomicrobiaceae bacterium]|nr:hypothetical protein [Thermomicrobiaceae bacterium]